MRSYPSRVRTEALKQCENREMVAARSRSRGQSIPLPSLSPPLVESTEDSDLESEKAQELEEEDEIPLSSKSEQKVSQEGWTYQLNVVAFCGKKCVYSKVKITRINIY